MKNKYIYFFKSDLSKHVDIYKSWVDVAKESIDISMVTILNYQTYKLQKDLVTHYREEGVKIFIVPKYTTQLFTLFYFSFLCMFNNKVVVHLRKKSPKPFNLLKILFSKKLKYIVEIEGDFESEIDYLSQPKNQYKRNFYTNIINSMKKSAKILEDDISNADGVFAVTDEMKKLFTSRYDVKSLRNKIHVIPTGFDSTKFYPDNNLRNKLKKEYSLEDKFIMIYSGNIFYSWQNLKRSLEVFLLLKEKKYPNLYFIMLVRQEDHSIANEFIDKLGIKDDEYMLKSVLHHEVNGFLNIADLGILLRENHMLNKVVTTGKLGEYLSSGLNVLTTYYIGNYSQKMDADNIGILIDDIYDDSEILMKIDGFKNTRTKDEINKWASDNFSVQAYKQKYVDALKSV